MTNTPQVLVSIDVGCYQHSVAVGLPSGELLEEFDIAHEPSGFDDLFKRIDAQRLHYGAGVSVAMEGYNGHARPLDTLIRLHDYRLFNINNLKLARFKEIFPGAAKSDRIDARKGLELFQLARHLPMAKEVLQEVPATPACNERLKRLSRRRRSLVQERARVLNRLQSDLRAVCSTLLGITGAADNLWFLHLLTHSDDLRKLARLHRKTLRQVRGVGRKYCAQIEHWQKAAHFSHEVDYVGPMIIDDAHRILELSGGIKALENECEGLMAESVVATQLRSIPGFGLTCVSELSGEIGTVERFASEASLALYLGMAPLTHSSGKHNGTKAPKQINARAKSAMMTAVDRHRRCVPQSQRYYEKKRADGKRHNQAIRALGRHMCRVLFKMLEQQRPYELRV